jgi:hypothetical protein
MVDVVVDGDGCGDVVGAQRPAQRVRDLPRKCAN